LKCLPTVIFSHEPPLEYAQYIDDILLRISFRFQEKEAVVRKQKLEKEIMEGRLVQFEEVVTNSVVEFSNCFSIQITITDMKLVFCKQI
jgi:hypothetical protein